jgi:hypothetical protein
MLCTILKQKSFAGPLDATDGLAAAMCHFFQTRISLPKETQKTGGTLKIGRKKSYSGWESFLTENPGRKV